MPDLLALPPRSPASRFLRRTADARREPRTDVLPTPADGVALKIGGGRTTSIRVSGPATYYGRGAPRRPLTICLEEDQVESRSRTSDRADEVELPNSGS